MNIKKVSSCFIILVFIMFIFNIESHAAEMKFSVKTVIPENQIDKNLTYFNLKMLPGQKQVLQVQLRNDTNKDIVVETYTNTAITNNNGVVDYTMIDPQLDSTLQIPFSEIAKAEKETEIPANSTITIDIQINMPKEQFDGIILGGLYFKEKESTKKDKKSDNLQIENNYAYVVGVVLSETNVAVKPEMKLNEINPTQINGRNVVNANLQNIKPNMIRNLNVDAKVYKEKGKKVLFKTQKKHIKVAPNSNFNFAVSWDNREFDPGTYRLEMQATNGNQHWEWIKSFTIDREEAKELNATAVEINTDYTIYYWICGILILILLLIFAFKLGKNSKINTITKDK